MFTKICRIYSITKTLTQGGVAFFAACKRSLGQGNVFTPVCHSVHRRGAGGLPNPLPPVVDRPPLGRPPWGRVGRPPPRMQTPPSRGYVNKRAVRNLLECTLQFVIIIGVSDSCPCDNLTLFVLDDSRKSCQGCVISNVTALASRSLSSHMVKGAFEFCCDFQDIFT